MRYSFVADHFQYLASLAPIVLFSCALGEGFPGWPRGGRGLLVPVATAALLLVLGALGWRQSWTYADEETLWRSTLAKNPDAFLAHNNLGVLLEAQGSLPEARGHHEQAIRI